MKIPLYKTTIGFFLIAGFALFTNTAFAQAVINPTRGALREERRAEIQTTRTQLKKNRAYQEIDRRVTSLNGLINRLNAIKRITAEQRTTLTTQVQAEIDKLTSLKTQIESETDPAKLLELKKSIILSYRIYVVFMPKIQIMAHADRILTVIDEMKEKTTNADVISKLDLASAKANEAITTVISLTPDGYPDNKAQMKDAREMLKEALQYLKDARLLFKQSSSSSVSS
ncbi:hypothetical protein A2334_00315 [Candidatus Roizmanbacteria bacterium RIFOXYB2_FULL_38_10]|uniref:DUF5667 domain-containing protein n=1 Tax=Candidatus Roizmanbacteria bacterium RIFOXYD1_FULL_38_12 TaxID=1802093 RepID=A0A1F7L2E1_9BACT|nr:MAG: hypothetical protein A3K47_05860 [Candidatus Roizmanbacteria bacterium RIFOXYA2_FULL_38_14]OGK64266.1 MAG: hypothetical protein A3K27_05860 [Candidatus Roizmanbacteria bacterium RIFOXYA1_FULL_37_12]OGK66112.1 MAG: hypothetical protein A3K38_05860 [Candidatus Roizmanbacteria bacterium RIFOXYB1_FULL_40_23]OGK67677.1 MAG: hypothetical protein A2334_00315 [Candidatus Roizmanbacteria bacterium RIFOXYB2_FULL_38_10]OGK70517.1 MAG: hypothetical protein A3K21_05865 [Candidatus Roizmanbacteria ba